MGYKTASNKAPFMPTSPQTAPVLALGISQVPISNLCSYEKDTEQIPDSE